MIGDKADLLTSKAFSEWHVNIFRQNCLKNFVTLWEFGLRNNRECFIFRHDSFREKFYFMKKKLPIGPFCLEIVIFPYLFYLHSISRILKQRIVPGIILKDDH